MKAQVKSDKELIGRYLQGDHNGLEILINRHQNRIFAYILMITKNKELADDIFQGDYGQLLKSEESLTSKYIY